MEALRTKYNLIVQRKKINNNVNEDETPALFVNFQQSPRKNSLKEYAGYVESMATKQMTAGIMRKKTRIQTTTTTTID